MRNGKVHRVYQFQLVETICLNLFRNHKNIFDSYLPPQTPGQGSTHRCRMQALSLGHSGLIVHSGRQFGGEPI